MIAKFLGVVSLVVFGFGIIGGFISDSFTNPIVLFHFIVGFVFGSAWAIKVGKESFGNAASVIKGRTTRYGAYALTYTLVFIVLISAVNWIANRHNKKIDLTEQGVYSLAAQSKELIKGLKFPVKITSFKGISENEAATDELLRRYKDENPSLVTIDTVDPKANPTRLKQYEMKQGNVLHLQYGDNERKAVSRLNETSEEAISNAILKLTRGAAKKVYVLQGHEEGDIENSQAGGFKAAKLAMQDENLNVEPLVLALTGQVPSDAALVIVFSPKQSIPVSEKRPLLEYVQNGGRLLLASDPQHSYDMADLAKAFGIEIRNDIVLDQIQRLFSGPQIGAQPIVTDYDVTSPITKSLTKQNLTIFTMSSSLGKVASTGTGASYSEFAKSSANAWGETNLTALLNEENPTATLDAQDNKGPVTLGISFEQEVQGAKADSTEKKVSRVVVFGSSSWIANEGIGNYANRDLFLNAVNWLAGEEGGYTIRAGTMRVSFAPISQNTFIMLLLLSFIVPEILLLLGLWVWWKRRS